MKQVLMVNPNCGATYYFVTAIFENTANIIYQIQWMLRIILNNWLFRSTDQTIFAMSPVLEAISICIFFQIKSGFALGVTLKY
jgi:hypothetical protein